MKILPTRIISGILLIAITLSTLTTPGLTADGWRFRSTTVERLATSIDRLEKHLDQYGTVVAKSPDVWGQARLTKYRAEYERVLASKQDAFAVTLNASISRSDQAFVTNALALQAAISGPRASILGPPLTTTTTKTQPVLVASQQTPPINLTFNDLAVSVPATTKQAQAIGPDGNPLFSSTTTSQTNRTAADLAIPAAASDPFGSQVTFGTPTLAAQSLRFEQPAIAIEPTLMLDQLSRYMNHLHELRRISDGDDKADSPGYALHLVRLPISILPGKKTREGYGAEVTFIAKPHLHEKLLPETFRGLVINDLVDQWGFPLAKFLDGEEERRYLRKSETQDLLTKAKASLQGAKGSKPEAEIEIALTAAFRYANQAKLLMSEIQMPPEAIDKVLTDISSLLASTRNVQDLTAALDKSTREFDLDKDASEIGLDSIQLKAIQEMRLQIKQMSHRPDKTMAKNAAVAQRHAREEMYKQIESFTAASTKNIDDLIERVDRALTIASADIQSLLTVPTLSTTPSRRSQQPFPISLAFEVHGGQGLQSVAQQMLRIRNDHHNTPSILILDIQKILSEEFNAAYDFLISQSHLWDHCTPDLALAVRQKNKVTLEILRTAFESECFSTGLSEDQLYTRALAWAIIVESALLNERLVQDMGHLAAAKNAYQLRTDWLPYFHPSPPQDAVCSFNEYVACRWPIHVVAVDPVTQDQNVADSFSQRRELQLALSLAFASGQINAQNFTRMARRLELDMDTVALNRTVVGFSHGNDTFGWRFQPRVQSPDTKGNIHAFAETLLTGGPSRDAILNQSRLEPGIRECSAIVIMPSFVPYAVFDMRTNWFRLSNPSRKELDLRDGVGLSEEIVQLRTLSQQCVQDQHKYRQDEVYRLTRAVSQLEERLPLQSTYVQMPFENSLGGFEFFNTGTPDLAPELKGFYGEPGLSQDANTTIFLVGDHFSVHETKVMVGGQSVTPVLLSRQVMQVTVTPQLNALDKLIDVHVATPYGVSNHIDVPILPKKEEAAAKASIDKAVADHLAKNHVDQFNWTTKEVRSQIGMCDECKVSSVRIIDNLGISNGTPFQNDVHAIELRAWVYTVSVKPDSKPVKVVKPMVIKNPNGGKVTSEDIASALKELFASGGLPQDTSTIQLDAYISFTDGETNQIVRLQDRLTLNIEFCKACNPPAASPTTAEASPFNADEATNGDASFLLSPVPETAVFETPTRSRRN